MITSIYHLTFASITDYLAYGLQIETCLNNGLDVKIVDISRLFNFPTPNHSEKYKHLVIQIDSYEKLEQFIRKASVSVIFNIQITYEWRFRKIFALMAKYSEKHFSVFLLGQLPFHSEAPLWTKIFTTHIAKIPFKIATRIVSSILFKTGKLKSQNILFYAGESLSGIVGKKYKFPINFFDYDRYLENPQIGNQKYAVFLDDGLFQHPDDKIVGNVIDDGVLESYQKSLNTFFDFIESTMNIKILVSPHPKIKHAPNFFGNRELVPGKSQQVVQNADFVFCHCSSSMSYAVCYNKPIVFLTDKTIIEFSKKYQPFNDYIHNFAKKLSSPVINLSEPLHPLAIESLKIDQKAYDDFKLNYLTTTQTRNTLSKDLILGYLKQIK